jgi:hypothetical protein
LTKTIATNKVDHDHPERKTTMTTNATEMVTGCRMFHRRKGHRNEHYGLIQGAASLKCRVALSPYLVDNFPALRLSSRSRRYQASKIVGGDFGSFNWCKEMYIREQEAALSAREQHVSMFTTNEYFRNTHNTIICWQPTVL